MFVSSLAALAIDTNFYIYFLKMPEKHTKYIKIPSGDRSQQRIRNALNPMKVLIFSSGQRLVWRSCGWTRGHDGGRGFRDAKPWDFGAKTNNPTTMPKFYLEQRCFMDSSWILKLGNSGSLLRFLLHNKIGYLVVALAFCLLISTAFLYRNLTQADSPQVTLAIAWFGIGWPKQKTPSHRAFPFSVDKQWFGRLLC